MATVKLCSIELVPVGKMKQFYVRDLELVVIHTDESFFCLDGRCTHAGAPLAEGRVDASILTCPWHGSQFNICDGSVIRGPAEKSLRSYSVYSRDGFVFVELSL